MKPQPKLAAATVQRRRTALEKRIKAAVSNAKRLYLESDLRGLQERCPHVRKNYCGGTPYDKGGYVCQDCGKEL